MDMDVVGDTILSHSQTAHVQTSKSCSISNSYTSFFPWAKSCEFLGCCLNGRGCGKKFVLGLNVGIVRVHPVSSYSKQTKRSGCQYHLIKCTPRQATGMSYNLLSEHGHITGRVPTRHSNAPDQTCAVPVCRTHL